MTDYTHNDTAAVDVPEMAATTVAGDLLAALIDELRLIERPWQSLPEVDQQDVIERLRARVKTNVEEAVRTIAADARPVIAAEVESVTVKDGIKAVLKLSKGDPNRHHLVDAQGDVVLIVVAGAAQYTGGLDAVQAEPDQRALGLGEEYNEEAA